MAWPITENAPGRARRFYAVPTRHIHHVAQHLAEDALTTSQGLQVHGTVVMARSRNIGSKDLASQESGRAPVKMRARAVARTTQFNSDAYDGGRPVGWWRLLTRPSGLFCVSLMAFLFVSGLKIWESGLLDPVIGPRGAGPIESGPIRFAPHERAAAKPYTAAPEPEPVVPAKDIEEENGDAR